MIIQALAIYLGPRQVGTLFKAQATGREPIIRFVAEEEFARDRGACLLSLSMVADKPEEQGALWANYTAPLFNGQYSPRNGYLLPSFFQNLLPEGVFRDEVARRRGCDPGDHFDMLAACGRDLPGNVQALPVDLGPAELANLLTQGNEPVEVQVMALPMDEGVSLSGVQPKLGVLKVGDRYVGRTRLADAHIIAKLPVVGYPRMPEVEELSLRLAKIVGVTVCEACLEPLAKLQAPHHYDLGEADAQTRFLAVSRFDRIAGGRVHCEDFAQVLSLPPEAKYARSYLEVAGVLMAHPGLREAAVHELLRRIVVNELLGNPDMHLKNIGLMYPDGLTPTLSPAYDVVAYSAFNARSGHALHLLPAGGGKPRRRSTALKQPLQAKPELTPMVLRDFCAALGIPEKPADKVLRALVRRAVEQWPALIAAADITPLQKQRLLGHFLGHAKVQSLLARMKTSAAEVAANSGLMLPGY